MLSSSGDSICGLSCYPIGTDWLSATAFFCTKALSRSVALVLLNTLHFCLISGLRDSNTYIHAYVCVRVSIFLILFFKLMLNKIDYSGYSSMNLTHTWIHIIMTTVRTQNNFITRKTFLGLSHFSHTWPITFGNHWSVLCHCCFIFLRMSYQWNYTVFNFLWDSFLSFCMSLRFIQVVSCISNQ